MVPRGWGVPFAGMEVQGCWAIVRRAFMCDCERRMGMEMEMEMETGGGSGCSGGGRLVLTNATEEQCASLIGGRGPAPIGCR